MDRTGGRDRSLPAAGAGIGITVAVCLVTLEAALRLSGISIPRLDMPDADLGWALRPGVEATIADENRQGVHVRINSDGLRDREHSLAKEPGTLRIAILGDSFAEAVQVPIEKTFWAVLENEMASCRLTEIRKTEAINFGVLGYSTAQELTMLRHKVWKYSPDVVLLAFFSGNDVRDNVRALGRVPRPYFAYRGDRLVPDHSFRNEIGIPVWGKLRDAVTRYSRLAEVAYGVYRRHRQEVEYRNEAVERGLDDRVFLPPDDHLWKEAWQVSEGLLGEMHAESRAHGARFWVVSLSNAIQVDPDLRKREEFRTRIGAETLFYPDLRIRKFCAREGIPVVTLAIPFADYAAQHHVFLHGFPGALGQGHWNDSGHRLAGQIISSRLCEDLSATWRPQPTT